MTHDKERGGKCLVAFLVPAGEGPDGLPAELRRFLAKRLLARMVPARLFPLSETPRTPNGNVDPKGLSRLASSALRSQAADYVAMQNAVKEPLAPLCEGVLDFFFALRGARSSE